MPLYNNPGILQAWTPTFSASGGMTFSANTSTARYSQIGKLVFFVLRAELTTATAAGLRISFTPPVTANATLTAGGGIIATDGGSFAGSWQLSAATQIDVKKYDLSNWTTPSAISFQISGFYEAA